MQCTICLPWKAKKVPELKAKINFKKNVNLCIKEKCYMTWNVLEQTSGLKQSSSSVETLWLWCPVLWIISKRHAFHWFHWDKSKCLCLWAFPRTRELQTLTNTKPTEIVLPCFWQIPKFWDLKFLTLHKSDGEICVLGLQYLPSISVEAFTAF